MTSSQRSIVVRSVHQHFRLDDRNKALFLTERGVPRQRVRICAHAGGARQSVSDMDDRAPLREAGAHSMVLREAVAEPVKSLGDGLVRRAGKRLRASVDFDAGKDALVREDLSERRAARTLLPDSLVLQDDPADELGRPRSGEEHFAVGAPALLGRLDPERVEPPRQSGDGLVGRENSFSVGNQRLCDALPLVTHPGILPVCAPVVCLPILRARRSAQRAAPEAASVTLTGCSFRGSLMRNPATYRAGKNGSVSRVATNTPPMIA